MFLLVPLIAAIFVLWDSNRRLGRIAWAWAAGAGLMCITALGQAGQELGRAISSRDDVAIILGRQLGTFAAAVVLYRLAAKQVPTERDRANRYIIALIVCEAYLFLAIVFLGERTYDSSGGLSWSFILLATLGFFAPLVGAFILIAMHQLGRTRRGAEDSRVT
jgi:hypothetical protein